ncbi:NADH-quinone oxidoreductase subunit D [Luteococcus peritonei]|uniref:NADH-quinone oxidoreductase subunit D n=1 Tax=Luteococcus peritonei TaxID=88874 RepID=A0ABW4RX65_9ACTN
MSHAMNDLYAQPNEAPADHVYLTQGSDWDEIVHEQAERGDETIVVNFGPHHPSTHGVLRMVLELDGENVVSLRPGIGFLHTGIEKNMEFRTWTQGVTYITRANYVANMFNEAVYCLGVEKLLGITVPERADVMRVLVMEVNRIASHLVAVGTGSLELGATSVAEVALREREMCLEFLQAITGLRMNNAFIRPGGVACDLPDDGLDRLRELIHWLDKHLPEIGAFCNANPVFRARLEDVATLDLTACMALGVTGPPLRATGHPWDLRKVQPYCGYENYDFDVVTWDTQDCYGRFRIRVEEMQQSVRILKQCLDKLEATMGQPVMVEDPHVKWPAQLSLGPDGQGNSNEHIKHIMGESMEALIHHFKIVTEGFQVPAGQVYTSVEAPGGELSMHLVSDGGTRPFRAHLRDPGFNHMQALPALCEGGMLSDIIPAVASIDPVMGGVDR